MKGAGRFKHAGKIQRTTDKFFCIVIAVITLLFLGFSVVGIYFCRYHTAVLPFVIPVPCKVAF